MFMFTGCEIEYLMRRNHVVNLTVTLVSLRCWKPLQYRFMPARLDSSRVGILEMHLHILTCLGFLGGILSTKINYGENPTIPEVSKACLSTVIAKLCPDCTTVRLVTPTKSVWGAEALACGFSDFLPMYAMTVYTMERSRYEKPPFDQVDLYLVNTELELKLALKNLRVAKSKGKYVVLVNFDFGRNLGSYLRSTIPATWKGAGNVQDIIFVASFEDDLQVFETPIQKSGVSEARNFRRLRVYDTKALIEVAEPLPTANESQETILTVTIRPMVLPYVERQTDSPGGFIEKFMQVIKSKLNVTPKYIWSDDDMSKFVRGNGLRFGFDWVPSQNLASDNLSTLWIPVRSVWAVTTRKQFDGENMFAMPLSNNIAPHLALLAIYTGAMIYFSRDIDKSRMMLRLFGMFFGIGVGWLPRKAMYRFLVILWCFTSYVLVQAYLAALTSGLTSSSINKRFRDSGDLMKSGMEMYCLEFIKQFYCNLTSKPSKYICEKCMIPGTLLIEQITTKKSSTSQTRHPFAITVNTDVLRSFFSNQSFTIIDEPIGSWPAAFYTNAGAEFRTKVIDISGRLTSGGIIKYWFNRYATHQSTADEHKYEIWNMSNLNNAFIILYIGWSCSIVVFIAEIWIKWRRNYYKI